MEPEGSLPYSQVPATFPYHMKGHKLQTLGPIIATKTWIARDFRWFINSPNNQANSVAWMGHSVCAGNVAVSMSVWCTIWTVYKKFREPVLKDGPI